MFFVERMSFIKNQDVYTEEKMNVPMYQFFLKALKDYNTGLNLLNIFINKNKWYIGTF